MPAPLGNKNAVGHDPGNAGRKNAIEELRDWKLLWQMYNGEVDRDELLKKIESGKYSIHQALMAKALSGNTQAQIEIFKKLFPDSLIIKGFERSLSQDEIEMSDEKYRNLITSEYNRLGLGRSKKTGGKT